MLEQLRCHFHSAAIGLAFRSPERRGRSIGKPRQQTLTVPAVHDALGGNRGEPRVRQRCFGIAKL
jgi:hypothetical protein